MRKSYLLSLFLLLWGFLPGSPLATLQADVQKEALTEVVNQLGTICDEQQTLIENLQKENEELQKDSEDKQILLMQSTETIEKLKNSLEEQRKSWMRTTIISSIVSAAIGLLIGALLL